MVWNAPHLHLLINHLPVFGSALAIPLFLLALWRPRDKGALLAALLILVLGATGGGIAVWTGGIAGDRLEGAPGISMKAMSEHENRADISAIALGIVGLAALFEGYLALKTSAQPPRIRVIALLIGTVIAAGLIGWTAEAGGLIHHDEIRPPEQSIEQLMQGK